MTIELRPLGVKCNIQCQYCYQNPQRDAGSTQRKYDLDIMIQAVERLGGAFTLFGGEPLLLPVPDLDRLWSWGFQRFGRNSVQTNGALIEEAHIALFERYNVQVGISIDGPGSLNDVRWAGSVEKTRRATARTEAAIALLCQKGRPPSLIVTLHKGNAAAHRLDVIVSWLMELEALGVRSVRFHLLEVDDPNIRKRYALSTEENIAALMRFAALEKQLKTLRLPLFVDMRSLLRGADQKVSCVWNACDSYATQAVQGIEGSGQSSNCGRTNKDGVDFTKADQSGYERYLALYQTPQSVGGCSGCRFFLMCKGQCPGTAIDGDWRNRTEYCEVWKAMFSHFERELVESGTWVLSRSKRRRGIEDAMMAAWAEGRSMRIAKALNAPSNAAPKATAPGVKSLARAEV